MRRAPRLYLCLLFSLLLAYFSPASATTFKLDLLLKVLSFPRTDDTLLSKYDLYDRYLSNLDRNFIFLPVENDDQEGKGPSKGPTDGANHEEEPETEPTEEEVKSKEAGTDKKEEGSKPEPLFDPWAIDELLEKLSKWIRENQVTLVLSLDLDGTAYINFPDGQQDKIEIQKDALHEFIRWLSNDPEGRTVFVIFNTAREYPPVGWEEMLTAEGLPIPHILIHGNGSFIYMPENPVSFFPGLGTIYKRLEEINKKLRELDRKQSQLLADQLTSSECFMVNLLKPMAQAEHALSENPSATMMLENEHYNQLQPCFIKMCRVAGSQAGCLELRKPRQFYTYSRLINKGMALMLVMDALWSILHNPRLFTAGDYVDDLSMLLFPLLSEAFSPPGSRKPTDNHLRAQVFKVSEDSLHAVLNSWQGGVLPPQVHPCLASLINPMGILEYPGIIVAEHLGLFGLLEAILEQAQSDRDKPLEESKPLEEPAHETTEELEKELEKLNLEPET